MGMVLTGYITQPVYYQMVIEVLTRLEKLNYEYETRN